MNKNIYNLIIPNLDWTDSFKNMIGLIRGEARVTSINQSIDRFIDWLIGNF